LYDLGMPKSKAADGMFRFFNNVGREHVPRARTFAKFTPEEIFGILQLISGRDAHDIITYANTCKSGSRKVTLEDVQHVADLFQVKEVQES
jgi:hypothetical protein